MDVKTLVPIPTVSNGRMHRSSTKTRSTPRSPFLLSERPPEAGKHKKNGTEKPHELTLVA